MPANLMRFIPNANKIAHSKPTHDTDCICDYINPKDCFLHQMELPTNPKGRTRHLFTQNPEVIGKLLPGLAELMKLPRSFIPNQTEQVGDAEDMLQRIADKLDEYHQNIAPELRRESREWIEKYKQDVRSMAKQPRGGIRPNPLGSTWQADVKDSKRMGIAIGLQDKSKLMIYMCNKLPHYFLMKDITDTEAYQPSPLSIKQVNQKHAKAMKRIYKTKVDIHPKPPIAQNTYKTHKKKKETHPFNEAKGRIVTNCFQRGLALQQKDLSTILTIIEEFHYNRIPGLTTCTNTIDFLRALPRNIHKHYGYDAVGFYPSMNISFGIHAIEMLIKETFKAQPRFNKHTHIRTSFGRAKFCNAPHDPKNKSHFTMSKIIALLRYLLNHQYIYAANKMWKQIEGCPQGGASSQKLTSLVAYYTERKSFPIMRTQYPNAFLSRYADDIYSNIHPEIFNIYMAAAYRQAGFTMGHEIPLAENSFELPFLETKISFSHKKARTPHYSKRDIHYPTDIVLPHRGSATPIAHQRAQLKSYIMRVYHTTSDVSDFMRILLATQNKQPEYTTREFATAAEDVITHTQQNRYALTHTQINQMRMCFMQKIHTSKPHLNFTHFLSQ